MALGRGRDDGYDPDHPFLVALRTDPVLSRVKLIAEPWDVGVARLAHRAVPAAVRASGTTASATPCATFWLPDVARSRTASRATGCASWPPGWPARRTCSARATAGPIASVNFVAAHDGFTLRRH